MPTRKQLETWVNGYAELWNAGEKDAWIANWKSVCHGDFKMFDPVGTPPKFDFEGCCLEPYDLFQPSTHFFIDPEENVIGIYMTQSAFLTTRQQLRDDFETAVMQALVDYAATH